MRRKTMLITGASSGIGAALAELAASEGWDIGLNYRADEAAARAVAAKAEAAGAKVALLPGDVSNAQDVERMFTRFDAELGELDALINNAGIVGEASRVEDLPKERLERMFAVNVLGSIYCAQEAVRRMAFRHGGTGGSIVNVSSVAARLGSAGEYVDYAASKGAIDTFSKGLADENARDGIRVNVLRPGITATPLHAKGGAPGREERLKDRIPMGRPGEAREIAEAILWLASDRASYVTGAFLDASGGR